MLHALEPRPDGAYLDGTLGAGGHAEAILERSAPDGRVIGLDLDANAVARARKRLEAYGERFVAVHGGYHEAPEILESLHISITDGIVLDLGLSSDQLEDPERGFSFQTDGPLDMRFDTMSGKALTDILRTMKEKQLAEILASLGGERRSRRLAREILRAGNRGRLRTTKDLADIVLGVVGRGKQKIHPATRTFQALRIYVNRELSNLERALKDLPALLAPGGRMVVMSYHSLEDGMVKRSFRERGRDKARWRVVTPKPIRPEREEIAANPRSRSARMRVLEALAE